MAMEESSRRASTAAPSKSRRKSTSSVTPTRSRAKERTSSSGDTLKSSRRSSKGKLDDAAPSPKPASGPLVIDWSTDADEGHSSSGTLMLQAKEDTAQQKLNARREKMMLIKKDSQRFNLQPSASMSGSSSVGGGMMRVAPTRRKSTGATVLLQTASAAAASAEKKSGASGIVPHRSASVSSFNRLSGTWQDNDAGGAETEGPDRVNKAKQRIHDMFLEQRKREHEARLARVKERIKLQSEAKEVLEKESAPSVRLERAYRLYRKLGKPDRKQMIQRVKELLKNHNGGGGNEASEQVSLQDVELLPWAAGGLLVNVAAYNKKMEEHLAKQKVHQENMAQIPVLLKAMAKGAAAAEEVDDEEQLLRAANKKQDAEKKKKKSSSSKKTGSLRKSKSSTSLDTLSRSLTKAEKEKPSDNVTSGDNNQEQGNHVFIIKGTLAVDEDNKARSHGKLKSKSSSKSLSALSLASGNSSGSGKHRKKKSSHSGSKSVKSSRGLSSGSKSVKSHHRKSSKNSSLIPLSSTEEGDESSTAVAASSSNGRTKKGSSSNKGETSTVPLSPLHDSGGFSLSQKRSFGSNDHRNHHNGDSATAPPRGPTENAPDHLFPVTWTTA